MNHLPRVFDGAPLAPPSGPRADLEFRDLSPGDVLVVDLLPTKIKKYIPDWQALNWTPDSFVNFVTDKVIKVIHSVSWQKREQRHLADDIDYSHVLVVVGASKDHIEIVDAVAPNVRRHVISKDSFHDLFRKATCLRSPDDGVKGRLIQTTDSFANRDPKIMYPVISLKHIRAGLHALFDSESSVCRNFDSFCQRNGYIDDNYMFCSHLVTEILDRAVGGQCAEKDAGLVLPFQIISIAKNYGFTQSNMTLATSQLPAPGWLRA